MNKLDERTFGATPAAMYLARALNDIGNETLTRSVTRRINGTAEQVKDLLAAVEAGTLKTKTAANCLRLLREEVSNDIDCVDWSPLNPWYFDEKSLYHIIDNLRRNVQIGNIKRGIRMMTEARKNLRIMTRFPSKREYMILIKNGNVARYRADGTLAGVISESGDGYVSEAICSLEDSITPELLMDRSNRRCKRLGKEHMKG